MKTAGAGAREYGATQLGSLDWAKGRFGPVTSYEEPIFPEGPNKLPGPEYAAKCTGVEATGDRYLTPLDLR